MNGGGFKRDFRRIQERHKESLFQYSVGIEGRLELDSKEIQEGFNRNSMETQTKLLQVESRRN